MFILSNHFFLQAYYSPQNKIFLSVGKNQTEPPDNSYPKPELLRILNETVNKNNYDRFNTTVKGWLTCSFVSRIPIHLCTTVFASRSPSYNHCSFPPHCRQNLSPGFTGLPQCLQNFGGGSSGFPIIAKDDGCFMAAGPITVCEDMLLTRLSLGF